ncbi:MAG TPA: MFS transporter, partial [Corynebacterium sp.]|nr:MFS transporter [Corynebacterium sp.]
MIGRRDWLRIGLAMFAIGYGANLFAPMLEVYRALNGTGQSSVTAMFGIYAAGLVPALLIFGPISDRRGRRAVLRPAMLVSAIGTVI